MNNQEKVERFLNRLKGSTNSYPSEALDQYTYSFDQPGVEPYKNNQSWPGRKYSLVGNSFNLESRILDINSDTKRTACIAVVIEKGKNNCNCVSIEDALAYEGFYEILSRFEYDWLSKQPPSTLIGPAYDEKGVLIPNSFSVWRREKVNRKYRVSAKQMSYR